jgi:spermidine/putrescine transport system ATP-binding protein
MVFQHYALFPHLTVEQNIGYGLKQRTPRPSKSEITEKVRKVLGLVRLEGFELLLLDEPLAALDRKLRKEMQIELQNLQRSLGITFVLVTHDQEEALSMSDRICIMKDGRIVQIGSPRELYDRPKNRYVAGFVGTSNFFDGKVSGTGKVFVSVSLAGGTYFEGVAIGEFGSGQDVCVSVRPEQIRLSRSSDKKDSLPVTVLNRIFLGEHTEYLVKHESLGEFLVLTPRQTELDEGPFNTGDTLLASWDAGAALILDNA